MEELKPCPFCGGNATIRGIISSSQGDERGMKYNIYCGKCSVYGFCFETKINFEKNGKVTVDETERTQAIEKWNSRAKDDKRNGD